MQAIALRGLVWTTFLGWVWLATGSLIAFFYSWATSGSWICFWWAVLLGPPGALLLLIVWECDNAYFTEKTGEDHWYGGPCGWLTLLYFCLPIILNGASMYSQNAGYETAAHYALALKYWSLVIALPFVLAAAIWIAKMISWQDPDKQKKVPAPPILPPLKLASPKH
jgi:hypothetical protein